MSKSEMKKQQKEQLVVYKRLNDMMKDIENQEKKG